MSSLAYYKQRHADRARGAGPRMTPAGPVAAHLALLRSAGITHAGISAASGIGQRAIHEIASARQPTVRTTTAAALLAVRPTRPDPTALVDATGTRRRIRALLRHGWRHQDITAAAGTTTGVTLAQPGTHVTAATATAVADAYRALSIRPGPSLRTRLRATAAGYYGPGVWLDVNMDDPAAQPDQEWRPQPRSRDDAVAEAAWLVAHGEHPAWVHTRVGIEAAHLRHIAKTRDPQLWAALADPYRRAA